MDDVKEYIRKKKKKKARRRNFMILFIVIISLIIFLTNAPIFKVKEVKLVGVSDVNVQEVTDKLEVLIGENIFTLNRKDVSNELLNNKYIKSVKISLSSFNKLKVSVEEESPIYYVSSGDKYLIISNDTYILEQVDSLSDKSMVEIKGLDIEGKKVGDQIVDDSQVSKILNEFEPYITENTESIKLKLLNVSDITSIVGKIGKVEIYFGDIDDLHTKMNEVYNIMLNDTIGITKGYIYVNTDGNPIIKKE